jgi:hypothetical protein
MPKLGGRVKMPRCRGRGTQHRGQPQEISGSGGHPERRPPPQHERITKGPQPLGLPRAWRMVPAPG